MREKVSQLLHHLRYVFVLLQKVDDHWILSGEGPEFGLPVGICKTAHVENIVGVDRRAMFKAERLEKQSGPASEIAASKFTVRRAQFMRGCMGRIDSAVYLLLQSG